MKGMPSDNPLHFILHPSSLLFQLQAQPVNLLHVVGLAPRGLGVAHFGQNICLNLLR